MTDAQNSTSLTPPARRTRVMVIGDLEEATIAANVLRQEGYAARAVNAELDADGLSWVDAADAVVFVYGDYDDEAIRALGMPCYDDVESLRKNHNPVLEGDPRFYGILREMGLLHAKKNRDYGTDEDPLANIRAAEEFTIPAWMAALNRENDKTVRLKTFCKKRTLANEGVEDSFLDKANYSVLALILYRECKDAPFAIQDAARDARGPQ